MAFRNFPLCRKCASYSDLARMYNKQSVYCRWPQEVQKERRFQFFVGWFMQK